MCAAVSCLVSPRRGRKVGRVGDARHIRVAVAVHGDPPALGTVSKIGGIDEGRARRIELCHEGTGAAGGLESSRRRREVGGECNSCHIGVTTGVHGDCVAPLSAAAAEISGIDEGGAGGIDLHNESVPSRERCLESPDRRREIGGVGLTRHVAVAVGIHGDPVARTVKEFGIDEHRAGGVELRHEAAARYVGVAIGVHGDAVATAAIAEEVGGIDEGGACGIELCDEGAGTAAEVGLEGSGCRRKIGGGGIACYVGVTGGIHGDPVAPVAGTAT